MVLFVSVVGPDDPESLEDIWFVTERYPVQIFGRLSILFGQATVVFQGRVLSAQEVLDHLRGYYTKDVSEVTSLPLRRLMRAVGPTIVEGLWIRVRGVIKASGGLSDVVVDKQELTGRTGDQDAPITGYEPWHYELVPEQIELGVTPKFQSSSSVDTT